MRVPSPQLNPRSEATTSRSLLPISSAVIKKLDLNPAPGAGLALRSDTCFPREGTGQLGWTGGGWWCLQGWTPQHPLAGHTRSSRFPSSRFSPFRAPAVLPRARTPHASPKGGTPAEPGSTEQRRPPRSTTYQLCAERLLAFRVHPPLSHFSQTKLPQALAPALKEQQGRCQQGRAHRSTSRRTLEAAGFSWCAGSWLDLYRNGLWHMESIRGGNTAWSRRTQARSRSLSQPAHLRARAEQS